MKAKHSIEEKVDICLKEGRIPFRKTKEEGWESVKDRIETAEVRSISASRPAVYMRYAAAAAVIAILLSVSAIIVGSSEVNSDQTIASIELPDGSSVTLNKNTTFSYNSALWYFNRSVELEKGEAFFDVIEGENFTVHTPNGNVEVLGTSFNVSTSASSFAVACKTGKVRVTDKNKTAEVILSPGKKTQLVKEGLAVSAIPSARIDSWTKGDFVFEDANVSAVFQEIEDNLGYTISYEEITETKYTGQFNINQPLSEVLDIICLPSGLKYRILESEKRIVVTNK